MEIIFGKWEDVREEHSNSLSGGEGGEVEAGRARE
jgi:hypothetical protein